MACCTNLGLALRYRMEPVNYRFGLTAEEMVNCRRPVSKQSWSMGCSKRLNLQHSWKMARWKVSFLTELVESYIEKDWFRTQLENGSLQESCFCTQVEHGTRRRTGFGTQHSFWHICFRYGIRG
ncbi:hypothetical protein CEXT_230501 [Caerostris extrusa]|uniref:Uncharacterized protein n=1 Tax=Caerostris extrusa TaxID=172846 RepID=A0AAV4U9M6_CAEEX|nr:hypothetical protein CEXT_230501 [Caerostris extrusa]